MNTLESFKQAAERRKIAKKERKKDPNSTKTHKYDMPQALLEAMKQNPDSPVVRKINTDNRHQAAEKIRLGEERRFAQLREQFKGVGHMWFGAQIDPAISRFLEHNRIRIPIEQKKEQWTQTLTILKNRRFEQRIELLRALASGMRLSEDSMSPADDEKYRKFFRLAPHGYSGDNPLGVSFTNPSRYFIEAVGDMSGHSREQQEKFREFMVREAGLKGKVGLPELFPGISRWLDHTRSQAPSH